MLEAVMVVRGSGWYDQYILEGRGNDGDSWVIIGANVTQRTHREQQVSQH